MRGDYFSYTPHHYFYWELSTSSFSHMWYLGIYIWMPIILALTNIKKSKKNRKIFERCSTMTCKKKSAQNMTYICRAVNQPSSSELTHLSSSSVHIRAELESSLPVLRAYRRARFELARVSSLLSSLASSVAWTVCWILVMMLLILAMACVDFWMKRR